MRRKTRLCYSVVRGGIALVVTRAHASLVKENLVMIALLVTLALLAVAAVVSTVIATVRDGYRRVPAVQR